MKEFSVIIPVYNRPKEVDELLQSLTDQTYDNFEVLIIEDGSTETCREVVRRYEGRLDIRYFYKENTGPGDSRNYGMAQADAPFMVFFDSDCIVPSDYFNIVQEALVQHSIDAYGGPDNAHYSFSKVQKAINYAMTSVMTTGGIRGKKNKMDHYQPRSFNMGLSREIYARIGGFSDIHPGEDPDLSYRIMNAGYNVHLIEKAYVYHKRRIDFGKFIKQVYKFGITRTILMKWYPNKVKPVYAFPTLFLLSSAVLFLLSLFISIVFLLPLLLLAFLLFIEAIIKTKSFSVSLLSVIASFLQLYGYGYGFLEGFINIFLLKRNEREAFPGFFFSRQAMPSK